MLSQLSLTASATLTGLTEPEALAFDANGNLYVANGTAGTVSKFSLGATTASATLTGVVDPKALAIDVRATCSWPTGAAPR